ncbi:MAG: class I SAM-dependent methyltransferase [Candidatus Micrarchaeota archaeon]
MIARPPSVVGAFNVIAEEWNEKHSKARAWVPLFEKFLKKTDVLLDAGCGNGVNSIALAPFVNKICAFDASPKMVFYARKNVRQAGLGKKISVKKASIFKIPFKNSFFDVVAYFAVVHHFAKPAEWKKVFSEMNRVLKKGGLAFVTVWNKFNAKELERLAHRNMLVSFVKKTGEKIPRMHYFFTERELVALVEANGFAVKEKFYEKSGKRVAREKAKNLCLVLRKA